MVWAACVLVLVGCGLKTFLKQGKVKSSAALYTSSSFAFVIHCLYHIGRMEGVQNTRLVEKTKASNARGFAGAKAYVMAYTGAIVRIEQLRTNVPGVIGCQAES